MTAIRLKTTHDINGNPRRIIVVLDDHGIKDVLEEDYRGETATLAEAGYRTRVTAEFQVTPGEYKDLKRRARGTSALRRRR